MPTTFAALGVPPELARSLENRGIVAPFPIQAATIPDLLAGRDLSGRAPTGSGKTIAFGIPLVLRVQRSRPKHPKGLVLVPTRELANQVADELVALAAGELRVHAIYGGVGFEGQLKALRRGVDIVVACPGRLGDLINKGVCHLDCVQMAVVDEADRMADMGFLPDVSRLLDQTPADRQTLLFSATLDGAVDQLVKRYQREPVRHEMAADDENQGQVEHHFWQSERPNRVALTADIIRRTGSTIVFCRTRHGADRVAEQLGRAGVPAAAIHGARSQSQRERALAAFHAGKVPALVATDVAARGIHVTGVECVVHFDLPADHKDYVHRSGRTGRAGRDGVVVSLVAAAQRNEASRLRSALDLTGGTTPPVMEQLGDGAVPGPTAMPAAAPAVDATPRRERPARKPSRPAADRREPVPTRAERPQSRERRPARPGGPAPSMREPRSERTADKPSAPPRPVRTTGSEWTADTPLGAPIASRRSAPVEAERHKDRPSGAARRKAKKEALVRAGLPPVKGKGRGGRGSRSRSAPTPHR